jgi:hypothetical protein
MVVDFGAQLRRHREQKGIGLHTIVQSTKISVGLLEALERNDISRWPTGLFRRAFIRAYATAIGLDPESTVREFLRHFPDPADESDGCVARVNSSLVAPSSREPADVLRLTFADDAPRVLTSARVDALMPIRGRASAAVYDLLILATLAMIAFAVAGEFWMTFAVAAVCYYVGGMLTLGNSPGAWLVARSRRRPTPPQHVTSTVSTPTAARADSTEPHQITRHASAFDSRVGTRLSVEDDSGLIQIGCGGESWYRPEMSSNTSREQASR